MTVSASREPLWDLLGLLFRSHPWHGVRIGDKAPEQITCYIEVVPTDTVKYEVDKHSGILELDRPQTFSNVCPTLYGLVPQTYCGSRVAALSRTRTGRELEGDADPLDICVFAERAISHGDILVQARPIGGLRMIDKNEADDKILAVLAGDAAYSSYQDIHDCPRPLIDRLVHYFETYKLTPNSGERPCEITHVYGRDEAYDVIRRSQEDYRERFGALTTLLDAALRG
jgi:inorganic pyrophosphatase